MVCYCLDLRGDSGLGKILANKLVSILAALVQLILWLTTLMSFIIQPDYIKERLQNSPSGYVAVSIITTLIIVAFSVLLLVGLFKGRVGFIKTYLIFNMVLTVLFVLSFFVNLFTQPGEVGAGGFVGMVLIILTLSSLLLHHQELLFGIHKQTE